MFIIHILSHEHDLIEVGLKITKGLGNIDFDDFKAWWKMLNIEKLFAILQF